MDPLASASHVKVEPATRSLAGQCALVTGANTGIGAAIAKRLASCGSNVAVNYLTNPRAAEVVAQACTALGSKSFAIEADISDANAVDRMFEQVNDRFSHLDVLVNNAGQDGVSALIWKANRRDWMRVIEVNLMGAFYCLQRALQDMIRRRKGVIINVTSVHELMPWRGFSAYAASKAALSMLSKTAALEAAPFGVRVVAVAPGAVQTAMNEHIWKHSKLRDQLIAKIPVRRLASPEEIATVVSWLASADANYQTGSTLFVDGGMLLYP